MRIEVGYGLEPLITDALAVRIRDNYIVPPLRKDDYTTGIRQGALAIAAVIAEDRGVDLSAQGVPAANRSRQSRKGSPLAGLFNLIFIIIVFMLLGRRGGRGLLAGLLIGQMLGGGRGRHYHGGGFGGGFGGGGVRFQRFSGEGFSGGGGASGGF